MMQEATKECAEIAQDKPVSISSGTESSCNSSDESELAKQGIDMDVVRKTMAGLQADTSSDDELIPPKLGAVVSSKVADVNDPSLNPWHEQAPSQPPTRKTEEYVEEADPWKFDPTNEADSAKLLKAEKGRPVS